MISAKTGMLIPMSAISSSQAEIAAAKSSSIQLFEFFHRNELTDVILEAKNIGLHAHIVDTDHTTSHPEPNASQEGESSVKRLTLQLSKRYSRSSQQPQQSESEEIIKGLSSLSLSSKIQVSSTPSITRVGAHVNVLCARCEYFRRWRAANASSLNMERYHVKRDFSIQVSNAEIRSNHTLIHLDIPGELLYDIIEFLYTGNIRIKNQYIYEMYQAASYLLLPSLRALSLKRAKALFLQEDLNLFWGVLRKARRDQKALEAEEARKRISEDAVKAPMLDASAKEPLARFASRGSLEKRAVDISELENPAIQPLSSNKQVQALTPTLAYIQFMIRFLESYAYNCLNQHDFLHLTEYELCQFLLNFDTLSAHEDYIFKRFVEWASVAEHVALCNAPIDIENTKLWSTAEYQVAIVKIRSLLASKPSLIRIMNLSAVYFSKYVEPLDILPRKEVVLKYRMDTLCAFNYHQNKPKVKKDIVDEQESIHPNRKPRPPSPPPLRREFLPVFQGPHWEIEARTRFLKATFESDHPHGRGVYESVTKTKVEMPFWCSKIRILFDSRCKLAKYSDLSVYSDEEGTHKIFSLYNALNGRRFGDLVSDPIYHLLAANAGGSSSSSSSVTAAQLEALLKERQKRRESEDASKGGTNNANNDDRIMVTVPGRLCWFAFYSPSSFEPGWGYKFELYPEIGF